LQQGLLLDCAVLIAPPSSTAYAFESYSRLLSLSERIERGMRLDLEQRTGLSMDELDVRHYGPKMTTPLLVVHDHDDRDVPHASGALVARSWPDARLVTTHGLGHYRILRDRGVVASVVNFVAGFSAELAPEHELERALPLETLVV
jgi:pimeloyl-ACP methyl ester carboxylesterase